MIWPYLQAVRARVDSVWHSYGEWQFCNVLNDSGRGPQKLPSESPGQGVRVNAGMNTVVLWSQIFFNTLEFLKMKFKL